MLGYSREEVDRLAYAGVEELIHPDHRQRHQSFIQSLLAMGSGNLYGMGLGIIILEPGCRKLKIEPHLGNLEWVEAGINGWLFPDGNAEILAQAISQAVTERDKLPEMGHAARRLAEKRANWDENFQQMLEAYQIVLRSH